MTAQTRSRGSAANTCPPTLESGDRLSRDEFHRRYELRDERFWAELVRGVVYVSSPLAGSAFFAQARALIAAELAPPATCSPRPIPALHGTLLLSTDSEVQPDMMLRLSPKRGGASRLDAEHYVVGAPELVAEIAASSASYDLHDKKDAYREAGVQEYVVWRVEDEAIDWWELRDGLYIPITPGPDGRTASRVFPGLALDLPGLVAAARAMREEELAEPEPRAG